MSRVRRGRDWVVDEPSPEYRLTDSNRRVLAALRIEGGNRSAAARRVGIAVQSVQHHVRRMRALGITVPPPARRGPDLRRRAVRNRAPADTAL